MTTRRVPRRPTWQPPPKTQPVDSARTKALRLPRPGPGIVVPIPLSLLPKYLELYSLAPIGIREPKQQPKYGPGEAILLVKRVKENKNV